MKQKHEFDDYAKNYRQDLDKSLHLSGESSTFFAEYKAQKLHSWFPQYQASAISILDFGCGDGLMTFFTKKIFPDAHVFGVDPSSESIKIALKNHPEISFHDNDGIHLPFKDHSFDLIYAAGAFHHIPFSEHDKCLSEVMRVLKPSGHFLLFELNPYNPLTVLTFKRNPIDKNATMMSPGYSKKLLKPYGNPKTIFYCFFPKALSGLRRIEPQLTWLPLGALYAIKLQKTKSLKSR